MAKVGIYATKGKASYQSSILMCALPAKLAGVKELILCSPQRSGEVNPYITAAVKICKIDKLFRVGGAQAIAAMAYGTETIPSVDKTVGPENAFVAAAKKTVFGKTDIDMTAGPSEVLIIADEGARPDFVAAYMLAQAERDEMASAVLLTISENLATAVVNELTSQLASLPKKRNGNEVAIKIRRVGCC